MQFSGKAWNPFVNAAPLFEALLRFYRIVTASPWQSGRHAAMFPLRHTSCRRAPTCSWNYKRVAALRSNNRIHSKKCTWCSTSYRVWTCKQLLTKSKELVRPWAGMPLFTSVWRKALKWTLFNLYFKIFFELCLDCLIPCFFLNLVQIRQGGWGKEGRGREGGWGARAARDRAYFGRVESSAEQLGLQGWVQHQAAWRRWARVCDRSLCGVVWGFARQQCRFCVTSAFAVLGL